MKKLFLVVLLFICSCSYGQEYKVVDIKGYYMVSYRKNEIAAKYENTIRKVFRQSYATAIDYSTRSFFVPTQINDSICNFENILNALKTSTAADADSIYIIPQKKDVDFLVKRNLLPKTGIKECCITSNAIDLSPYYIIDSNEDYLFRCVYIEGNARLYDIKNIDKDWQPYILDMYQRNTRVMNQTLFILENITNYTPYIEKERFTKWLPYREK